MAKLQTLCVTMWLREMVFYNSCLRFCQQKLVIKCNYNYFNTNTILIRQLIKLFCNKTIFEPWEQCYRWNSATPQEQCYCSEIVLFFWLQRAYQCRNSRQPCISCEQRDRLGIALSLGNNAISWEQCQPQGIVLFIELFPSDKIICEINYFQLHYLTCIFKIK